MDRARHDLTPASLAAARALLRTLYRAPESSLLPPLLEMAYSTAEENARIREHAHRLVEQQRAAPDDDWIAGFLSEYSLDSAEGMALLTLAGAFLRVPDSGSARELLHDKIGQADWRAHAGSSPSTLVNATTSGLVLAGALVRDEGGALRKLLQRTSEAFLHRAIAAALRLMAGHFVLGETIGEGLAHARDRQLVCSFDMLGEAARTRADADRYFEAYEQAILACGEAQAVSGAHSISVKLSALHPRYEVLQADRCVPELAERLTHLSQLAAERHIGLNVDAEESERLELSLDIVERVMRQARLRDWQGPGIVVQAYQKRAIAVVAWAECLAGETGKRLPVRLVKGAYWDTEIKRCQERGLTDYPVWLRKSGTDATYLACARRLLACRRLHPAFATHNVLTVATLLSWIGPRRDLEFQRLHGMGAALYDRLQVEAGILCRVYAPIGSYRELLAYLVRRMLENGANSSFIHQLKDERITEQRLLADPVEAARQTLGTPHPFIRLPADLFAPERRNSAGMDLSDRGVLDALSASFGRHWQSPVQATPGIAASADVATSMPVVSPANPRLVVGTVRHATTADVHAAVAAAASVRQSWADMAVEQRAGILRRLADLLEEQRDALMALLVREAGKTRADAVNEVREAVDFCRYYAVQAISALAERLLPGPTGERNTLVLRGRGVFACISPWNFPLSIFVGQVGAALVTGNTVLAKPAPQTPLIAAVAVRLAWEAGVPSDVLQLLPGGGETGEALVADARVDGVAFTGSTATAWRIAQRLLEDSARPLVPLIAETGGINAMIVDSTALTEQVCGDVITSAFQSAGQRCSALRLLCLQEEIYERTLDMIRGAMLELRVGDPADEHTDVGPIIDRTAHQRIDSYLRTNRDRIVCATPLSPGLAGWFIAPTVLALDAPEDLREEVFGPVLHVVRWRAGRLEELIDALHRSGYGLTMGLHTRLDSVVDLVRRRARVGNLYVNRSMIGAVVGSQPFGGEGISGTGPKAGGPHYLQRFCTERAVSVDTTSAGGNVTLMSEVEE